MFFFLLGMTVFVMSVEVSSISELSQQEENFDMESCLPGYHLNVTDWGSDPPELGYKAPVPLFVALLDNTGEEMMTAWVAVGF